jgi:hypothetical protein
MRQSMISEAFNRIQNRIASTQAERDLFDWASDPVQEMMESEDARDEMQELNISLEQYMLDDLIYRFETQLPSMVAEQIGTDEYRKAQSHARTAIKLANKLKALHHK